jgi:hypothetical protein
MGSGSGDNGCSAAAMFVYTVDVNSTFSQFDPGAKKFTDIGQLKCNAGGGATPFSMGVDRNAVAWVLYSNGKIFQVDTTTLACTGTSWAGTGSLQQFGMGFSTNDVGGTTDTLFVAGGTIGPLGPMGPTTLATLDTTSMSSKNVGMVSGWPELTGNSNAELWGWFPDPSNPTVQKLDKTTGNAITTFKLDSLAGNPMDWAFAFWGGDYWVFLERDTDGATIVYQIDGTAGTVTSMTNTNTRSIVGAGVSTCAPVVIE